MFGCSRVKGKGLFFCSPDVSHKPEVLHLKFAPLLQGLHLPHYSTVPSFPLCSFSQGACEEATQVLCRRVLQNPPAAELVVFPLVVDFSYLMPWRRRYFQGFFTPGATTSAHGAGTLAAPLPLGDTVLGPLKSCTQEFWSFSRNGGVYCRDVFAPTLTYCQQVHI